MAVAHGIQNIKALVGEVGSLEVPEFQRNFSWEESQIDDFHNDIIGAVNSGVNHFIGPTILMKKENTEKDFFIIDGQQRFTTIFMYVALIRDQIRNLNLKDKVLLAEQRPLDPLYMADDFIFMSNISSTVKFKSNELIGDFFNDYVLRSKGKKPMPSEHNQYNQNLIKAYNRLNIRIEEELLKVSDEQKKLEKLFEIMQTLLTKTEMLRIDTTGLLESYNIFMTLNSRGLSLGPSDLVKSLFMKYASTPEDEKSQKESNIKVSNLWREITDALGDKGDPDQFLRHYLIAKKTENPVQAKVIFSKMEKIITSEEVAKGSDLKKIAHESTELLKDLVKFSYIYSKMIDPSEIEDEVIASHCLYLNELLDSYRIVMMHILDFENSLVTNERQELSRLCEVLAIRWGLLGKSRQDLENEFQKLSIMLREPKIDFKDIVNKFIEIIPPDEQLRPQFGLEISRANYVRVVLHKINRSLYVTDAITSDPHKMHVEHIAPKKSTESWLELLLPEVKKEELSRKYAMYSEFWGNKTILEKTINSQILQSLFKVKRDGVPEKKMKGYKDSAVKLTSELREINEWSTDIIESRNKWIEDCFFKIWSVNSSLNMLKTYENWLKLHS